MFSQFALLPLFVCAAPDERATPPDLASVIAAADSLCQPLVDSGTAVGLVVGAIAPQPGGGTTIIVRGYGRVARDRDDVPSADTVYEIGSVSKVFTSLLLADQVQRGLVTLDDPVQKHLPEIVPMPTFEGDPVLLWHLATHTSGLPRMPTNFMPRDPMNPYADYTADLLYANLPELVLADEPGATMAYSNLGAGLLGHVLCRAGGVDSYEQLLVERICAPLRMKSTRITFTPSMQERLAPPHDPDGAPGHVWDLNVLAGAGGIRSTVGDMLSFADAQLFPDQNELASAIKLSHERRHDGGGPGVALGWMFAQDGTTLWHNGQTGGYHSFLGVNPPARAAVVVLCNSPIPHPDTVGDRLLGFLLGKELEPLALATPVDVDRAVLERYVGTYTMNPLTKFTITLGDDGLSAQLTGQDAFRVYPTSETRFFYRVVDAALTFEVDESGAVQALVLHQNGRDMRFARDAT